jgi:UrcA family protein
MSIAPHRLTVVTGVLGALLAISPVLARDVDRDVTSQSTATEKIEVYAPHFRVDRSRANSLVNKISLSRAVRYDDLDLRTARGARELRLRVRDVARDICSELQEAYPVPEAPGTSCYRAAVEDAMWRADGAIRDARENSY